MPYLHQYSAPAPAGFFTGAAVVPFKIGTDRSGHFASDSVSGDAGSVPVAGTPGSWTTLGGHADGTPGYSGKFGELIVYGTDSSPEEAVLAEDGLAAPYRLTLLDRNSDGLPDWRARFLLGGSAFSLVDRSRPTIATVSLYRLWLYGHGEIRVQPDEEGGQNPTAPKRGFTPEEVEAEKPSGGKLPLKRVIRRRARYLIDGGVFGSAAFVEKVFLQYRERFGLKRKTGARRMRDADWEGLSVLRDLKNDLMGEPTARRK